MRRYIDKFYQTRDAEPKEGGHRPMKLHGDCEQLFLLQMIMERSGIYLLSSADFIQFQNKSPLKMHLIQRLTGIHQVENLLFLYISVNFIQ